MVVVQINPDSTLIVASPVCAGGAAATTGEPEEDLALPLGDAVGEEEPWVVVEAPDEPVGFADSVEESDGVDFASDSLLGIVVGIGIVLLEVGLSAKPARILISWHWPPIDSSYRLPNSPLMQRHHLVVPPMASEPFLHTEKPPVYIAPA